MELLPFMIIFCLEIKARMEQLKLKYESVNCCILTYFDTQLSSSVINSVQSIPPFQQSQFI